MRREEPYERRFRYHASAVAFGARLEIPKVSDARAAVVLPSIGGRASASDSGYLLDAGFVRYEMAGSELIGELADEGGRAVRRTRAHTWIKGLRVMAGRDLEVLRIAELRVTLESRQPQTQGEARKQALEFRSLQVAQDGLQICGQPCPPAGTAELAWIDRPTFGEVLRGIPGERPRQALTAGKATKPDPKRIYILSPPDGKSELQTLADGAPRGDFMVFAIAPPEMKSFNETLARGKDWSGWEAAAAVGGLIVRGPLGWFRFYLGEFVVSGARRRFTALRMVFARSPVSEVIVAEVDINGSEHP